jgi:ribosomal protein S18 acetylase RimI-like enzyme
MGKPTDSRAIRLVGRRDEVEALARAIESGQSRLIVGPPGIGKSRLIAEALSRHPAPYSLLQRPLKPALLKALQAAPRTILLEDVVNSDPKLYRFLQQLYHSPHNCLLVTTRSLDSIGYLRKLLWDPREQVYLKPLKRAEAAALFETAVAAYQLDSRDLLDWDDFRNKVLRSARGNPGQILAMCRLAVRPEYRVGRRIRFLPLRMDILPAFV